MKKLITSVFLIVGIIAMFATSTLAAGSAATGTKPGQPLYPGPGGILVLQWTWTSDDAAGTVTNLGEIANVSGLILGGYAVPSTGDTAPSASYTVTISQKVSTGLYAPIATSSALPAASSTTGNSFVLLTPDGNGFPYVRNATLVLSATGCGNANQGTVYLYISVK